MRCERYGNNSHWRSAASLVQISTSPIKYERRLQDGSVEVFAQSDGATSGERRIFLTEIIDPRGQKLTLKYDSSLRLGNVTSQTDPLGRRTSYTYATNGIDLLEVRQTTGSLNDLLGSYASYATGHQPQSITDAAGKTTTLTYNTEGAGHSTMVLERRGAQNLIALFCCGSGCQVNQ